MNEFIWLNLNGNFKHQRKKGDLINVTSSADKYTGQKHVFQRFMKWLSVKTFMCDFSSIIPWKIQMCFISDLQYVGDFELQ